MKSMMTLKRGLSLQTLIEAVKQTADHIMITDREGLIEYVNPSFENNTGYYLHEIAGQTPRILKSGEHDQAYYKVLWDTILKGNVFKAVTINKKKNGTLYHAEQNITPILNERGEVTHFVSVWRDVTEKKLFEKNQRVLNEKLEFEKYKLEQILSFDKHIAEISNFYKLVDFITLKACDILESDRCSVMFIDHDNEMLCIKGAIGINEKIIKQKPVLIKDSVATNVVKEGKPLLVRNVEKDPRFKRKNRSQYRAKSFMCVPIEVDRKIIGVVNITEKRTESQVYTQMDLKILMAIVRQAAVAIQNAHITRELKYLSIKDPLTKLFNFRYFTDCLDQEVKRAKRFGRPLSLIIIDIDNFQEYNRRFSSNEGDKLLKNISRTIVSVLREVDIVCRYADDEFVIVLPETNLEQAKVVSQKIREAVALLQAKTRITICLGVVQRGSMMSRLGLIRKADQALIDAKNKGQSSYMYYG